MKDQDFVNQFLVIIGVLAAIAVVIFIIADVLSSKDETMDMAMEHRTQERIAPVSRVNIGTVPAQAARVAVAVSEPAAADPESIYQSACQVCHAAGVLQAPRLDDKAAWETRLANGVDSLYQTALVGRGNMPSKGGRTDLSDELIRQTVDYMLNAVGLSPR